MASIKLFHRFAKGPAVAMTNHNTCVIYTRVSTKEQADNNMSLDIQRRACEQYARKNNMMITAYFGGTYESAKTDERKEFNNMLDFVRKSRNKISFIIVYTVDRFSRSGANAIYISEQLKQEGISLISVSQPTDVSTPSGKLQQNIQFIFSEYDNQLRREKTVAGMKNKFLMGEWCIKPPIGYDTIKINGKRSIVPNSDGNLIRKAFQWKYYERLPQTGIIERLKALGLHINKSRISAILKNPFYCGIIVNRMLEGKVVQGKHEKIVSRELFLAVNGMLSDRKERNYNILNPEVPLKHTLWCEACKKKMTGYIVNGKGIYYYKCSTIGCRSNKNASQLHQLFLEELKKIRPDASTFSGLITELTGSMAEIRKINRSSSGTYKSALTKLKTKVSVLESRFALGEITAELFGKCMRNFQEQKLNLEQELQIINEGKRTLVEGDHPEAGKNPDIPSLWQNGNLQVKRMIQLTIFPHGIYYNRNNNMLSVRQHIAA